MDFSLTDDQREIQALAREFAQAEIEPHAAAWDREHRFPAELFAKLAELGLMGVCVPEEYGGAGADFLSYILVLEELSRADAGVGVTVAVHTSAVHAADPRLRHRRAAERFVPPLARGETIGAFALTEPDSGSDAGALRTRAEPDGDGWRSPARSSGSRTASYAGTFLLFARTDPETEGARGVSAFVLDARARRGDARGGEARPQLVVDRRPRASTAPRRPRPPAARGAASGFTVAMATLDGGRIGIAAQALGIAQAAYDVAREYAKERRAFGRRIADFQAIQWKLADMATRDRRRAAARLPRGLAEGAGRAAHRGGREGEALRLRDGAPADRPRRSRSSAATATRRSSRSSATTATRRSRRSTRGRARSSGS